eukprot:Sspe_Gene.39923::Locus_19241_Transcript_1_1_Confidence_1.000_Length_3369::g.39923::m.39923
MATPRPVMLYRRQVSPSSSLQFLDPDGPLPSPPPADWRSQTAPPAGRSTQDEGIAPRPQSADDVSEYCDVISKKRRQIQEAQVLGAPEELPAEEADDDVASVASSCLTVARINSIRGELGGKINYNPIENTVTLTRAEIEAIRDPATLEYLAQTPGLAKYVTNGVEEWRHCSVFITATDPDGLPEDATIDEETITLPVAAPLPDSALEKQSHAAAQVADFLSRPEVDADEVGDQADPSEDSVEEEEDIEETLMGSSVGPSDSTSTATRGVRAQKPMTRLQRNSRAVIDERTTSGVPSFMRGTVAADKKKRDLLREKEEKLEKPQPPSPQPPPPPPARPAPKPRQQEVALKTTSRRCLEPEELERVLAIENDVRFDAEDVPVNEGEGYGLSVEDRAKEDELMQALLKLRPEAQDLMVPPDPLGKSTVRRNRTREPEPDSDKVLRAREEALCVRAPGDYLDEQHEAREHRNKVASLNDRLSALYEANTEFETQLQLEGDSDEYRGRLSSDVLSKLLADAAKEQGRDLPALDDDAEMTDETPVRAAASRAAEEDAECLQGDLEMDPQFSGYGVDPDELPLDPEALFSKPDQLPPPPSPPPPERPSSSLSTTREDFLKGNWDALLERGREGDLVRPGSAASGRRPVPAPSPLPDLCPKAPSEAVRR